MFWVSRVWSTLLWSNPATENNSSKCWCLPLEKPWGFPWMSRCHNKKLAKPTGFRFVPLKSMEIHEKSHENTVECSALGGSNVFHSCSKVPFQWAFPAAAVPIPSTSPWSQSPGAAANSPCQHGYLPKLKTWEPLLRIIEINPSPVLIPYIKLNHPWPFPNCSTAGLKTAADSSRSR